VDAGRGLIEKTGTADNIIDAMAAVDEVDIDIKLEEGPSGCYSMDRAGVGAEEREEREEREKEEGEDEEERGRRRE
jgi:ribosomal protein L12E/L44/L45/RPP1/RPP2